MSEEKNIKINITNWIPTSQIKNPHAIASDLVVEYKMTVKNDVKDTSHIALMSFAEEKILQKYEYKTGLTLFNGVIKTNLQVDKWNVSFFEVISNKQIANIFMNKDEYSAFIETLNKSIEMKNSLRNNWKSFSEEWQKTFQQLDKTHPK